MAKSSLLNIKTLGEKLKEAGRLKLRPLCVYGSNEIPEGAVPSYQVDQCIAKAIYTSALFENTPSLYLDVSHEKCCIGGRTYTGLIEPHPLISYFVTVGTPDFMGGVAEHLKAAPELMDEGLKKVGKITPPGKYIIIRSCIDDISSEIIKSIILFGGCEQIRNLSALSQFNSSDFFFKTLIPGGPICATMLTFPAGMAENAPKGSSYVGPSDPTGNTWFPPDLLIMGIPIELAKQMATDLEESFICKRSKIAYPDKRSAIKLYK